MRGPNEDYEELRLELQYGDLYRATLPASRMTPPGIEYCVEGVLPSGERLALLSTCARPVRVKMGTGAWAGEEKEPQGAQGADRQEGEEGQGRAEVEKPPEETEPETAEPEEPKPAEEGGQGRGEEGAATRGARAVHAAGEGRRRSRPGRSRPPAPSPRRASTPSRPSAPSSRRSSPSTAPRIRAAQVQHLETRSLKSTLAPIVLTAEQLKQLGVRTVAEALDLVPGLSVSRDVQGFYRVAVRGLRNDPELLVLLDGQRLNNFYDGKALLTLPVETLERIEVYRGPATVDFGPGDFLGVVNLVTNRDDGVRLLASGGSWDAFDAHLTAARRFGALQFFGSGDLVTQYGYKRPVLRDVFDTPTVTRAQVHAATSASLVNAGAGRRLHERRGGHARASPAASSSKIAAPSSAPSTRWATTRGCSGRPSRALCRGGSRSRTRRPSRRGPSIDQQSTDRLWQLTPPATRRGRTTRRRSSPTACWRSIQVGARTLGLDARARAHLPRENRLEAGLARRGAVAHLVRRLTNYQVGTNTYTPTLARPDGLVYPTEDGTGGRGQAADRLTLGLFAQDTWRPARCSRCRPAFGSISSSSRCPTRPASSPAPPSGRPRARASASSSRPSTRWRCASTTAAASARPRCRSSPSARPTATSTRAASSATPQLVPATIDSVEGGFEYLQGVGDARLRLIATTFYERLANPIASVDTTGNHGALGEPAAGRAGPRRSTARPGSSSRGGRTPG